MNYLKFLNLCIGIGLLFLMSNCTKDVMVGDIKNAKIVILNGQNQTDSVNTTLREPVTFKVIDSISGLEISVDSFHVECRSQTNLLEPLKGSFFHNYVVNLSRYYFNNTFSGNWTLNCAVGTQTLNIALFNYRTVQPLGTAHVTATALPVERSVETPCSFGTAPTHSLFRQPNGTLYLGLDKSFFKSTDGGGSWQNIVLPKTGAVTQIYVSGQKILINIHTLVGTINLTEVNDLYLSKDGGTSWKSIGSSLNNSVFGYINKMSITSQDKILIYSAYMTYIFNENSGIWTKFMPESHDTFFDDNLGNVYYLDTNKYLYSSKDNNQTWQRNVLSSDFTRISTFLKEENSNRIFAFSNEGTGSKIYRSSDSGNSWTNIVTTTFPIDGIQQVGNVYFARSGWFNTLRLDANFNLIETITPSTDNYNLCNLTAMTEKKLIRLHKNLQTLIYHLK